MDPIFVVLSETKDKKIKEYGKSWKGHSQLWDASLQTLRMQKVAKAAEAAFEIWKKKNVLGVGGLEDLVSWGIRL